MPRLDRLSELQRKSSLAHPCLLNDSAPFTRPRRPLSQSPTSRWSRRLASTCAATHLSSAAINRFGRFPPNTPAADIVQSHASIGFDRTAFQRDINVVFPIDRVREFVARGEIGSLGR